MSYEAIVLELMSRIKTLESDCSNMKARLEVLENLVENINSSGGIPPEIEIPEERIISYGKMTQEMIDICYAYGKQLYSDPRLDVGALADKIFAETGMNSSSAHIYVYVVDCMLRGTVYKRAISTKATLAYLGKIKAEYGKNSLRKALNALKAHIGYRQGLGHTVTGLIDLHKEYESML